MFISLPAPVTLRGSWPSAERGLLREDPTPGEAVWCDAMKGSIQKRLDGKTGE
jgi:hypothetical protein